MSLMILVTGGTGFIGRNLIKALVESGHKVRILLKPSTTSPNFPKGIPVEVAVSSLSDQRGVRAALKDVNQIFHLAGAERKGSRGDLNQVDVEGTSTLMQAAKETKIDRVYYLSHHGAARASAYPVLKAKAIAEHWIINSGIPYTIVRTGSVFGPGDQFTVPLAKLIKISPIFLMPSKGHVLLQPLWIDDLINVLLLIMEDPKAVNRIYSIGGMEPLPYREIVRLIMNKTGIKRYIIPVSPATLRSLSLWIDQIFPSFPVSIFWLDHLAEDRTANLDSLPREFGIMPARFHQHLDYLTTEIKKRK
ncbi:MAG: NAD-dependent epimerase/dehydratase [uncultured bacterium]|nr:MAG: NAD-dependent epimerase/dehydratase [uncultured bacterium]